MSVISDWFSRLFSKTANHYVFAPIPAERQDRPVKGVTLKAEEHYFRIWVSEMFLKDDRRLFREFVPVVHSAINLTFGTSSGHQQELPYVAGPLQIGLGSTLGKGVQINHPLTNQLPFRGGLITVSAGLVAYKRNDYFQGFLGILNDVSGLFNVGQLSSTIKVVGGVADGIQNLLGAGDKDVHLVYFEGFGGETDSGGSSFESGYRAIIQADARTFDKSKLYVKESGLCYGNSLASSLPLEGYDYMLLRFEVTDHRDDFRSFEEFARLIAEAIKAGLEDKSKGDEIIKGAKSLAFASPDLTLVDRIRVGKAIQKEYEETLTSLERVERPEKDRTESFNEAVKGIPVSLAKNRLEEAFESGRLDYHKFMKVVETCEN